MDFLEGIITSYALLAWAVGSLRFFGWKPVDCPIWLFSSECIGCGILWPYIAFRVMYKEFGV